MEEEQAREHGFQLNATENRHIIGVEVVSISVPGELLASKQRTVAEPNFVLYASRGSASLSGSLTAHIDIWVTEQFNELRQSPPSSRAQSPRSSASPSRIFGPPEPTLG